MTPNTSSPQQSSELCRAAALAAIFASPGLLGTAYAQAPASQPAKPAEPGKAAATGDTVKLDDVVVLGQAERQVSSPKYTQPVLDTPQTLVVIPREIYSQQGAATLSDVLRNTPGITFLAGEGGNASSADGDSFFMRGFDTSNNIFVDGVRDTGQYTRDVFNLEQVEIAKGPAGSDVGRGVTSGYVNLSTKVPQTTSFQAATASYGSEDAIRGTVDVNQTLSTNVAVRVNAMWQDGGVAGRRGTERNRWGIAPSFALGLGTPTRGYISFQHLKYDDIPDYGLPRAAMPGPSGAGSFTPVPPAVSQKTFYGTIHDFDDVTSNAFTARAEHDFSPNLSISNQTRISETERLAILTTATNYTAATGLVTRSRQGNQRENGTISNLTNLLAKFNTGTVRHDLSAGVEYLYETQTTTSYTSVADANAPGLNTSLTNPDNNTRYINPLPSGASNWAGIETVGLYAFDTLKFNDSWQASGGFRIDNYDASYRTTAAGVGGAVTRLEADDSIVSWKLGVVYKPATNASIYAAYGTSQRPPGTNFSASNTGAGVDNLSLDPQETFNYEVGTKWDFLKGRLSTTAALFRTENTNVPTTDTVSGAIVQQNDQIVQGIELGVTGKITDAWLVYGGFSYLDAEYSAPTSSANAGTDGAELQWTPEVSGNFWTTYRLANGLTFGGGAQYVGTTQRQTTNTPAAALPETPDYWIFNAVVTYPVTKNLIVRLNVNNVFDEFYIRSLNNNANRYNPGTPRSFLVSADLRF